MDANPVVSVVTIFLNAEKFIEEAIGSVVAQTSSAWELILVDDGSTDYSTALARTYAIRYPNCIGYVEHPNHENRGMSASRNLGVRESRGKYVAFLDADDIFMPEKLAKQVAVLEQNPQAAMTYGPTLNWRSWADGSNEQSQDDLRTVGVQADRLYRPPELFVSFLENTAHTPGTCSSLIRREAIEKAGGFEERFPGMFEDQAFFYKICLQEPVYVESECLSLYRQHPDSYCNVARRDGSWDPGSRHPQARGEFLAWLEGYLEAREIDDPRIRQALRTERREYVRPKLNRLVSYLHRLMDKLNR